MISSGPACSSAESVLPLEGSILAGVCDWTQEHLGRCSPVATDSSHQLGQYVHNWVSWTSGFIRLLSHRSVRPPPPTHVLRTDGNVTLLQEVTYVLPSFHLSERSPSSAQTNGSIILSGIVSLQDALLRDWQSHLATHQAAVGAAARSCIASV